MDFSLAHLALVFLPGIIWANIDAKYGAGLRPTNTQLFVRSFVFGMSAYSVVFVGYLCFDKDFGLSAVEDARNINLSNFYDEIFISIPAALVLSVAWLYWVKNRCLGKFLNKIRATNRFGDEDVWSFTFNSEMPEVEFVNIRDVELGYIFTGYVDKYSENESFREIVLNDVIVYFSDTAEEMTRVPNLYISRPKENLWIEFPYSEGSNNES